MNKEDNIKRRPNQPDVVNVQTEDGRMNWAIKKSKLTLHYFKTCLKSPKPYQQYFSIKVKIEDNGMVEHIWLNQPSFDEDGNLFGVVGNEPINVANVSINQKIGIDEELISDWMIIENGRLIGGYTIRALRDGLTGNDLINFDKGLGGMVVDYGEDYFLPSSSIPEGAILQIEEAYDNDDIEKAIECKDFVVEAEVMLSSLGKTDLGKEMINTLAETIKLSFIKSLQENGMPKFKGVKRAFPKREQLNENHMIITEVCYYPDGGMSIQRLNTYKTENGWKVLFLEKG